MSLHKLHYGQQLLLDKYLTNTRENNLAMQSDVCKCSAVGFAEIRSHLQKCAQAE
jgi:hypothetical protein